MIVRCIYSILSSTSAEKQPDHRTLQTKTITIAKFETEEVVARLIEVLDYEDTMMIQESLSNFDQGFEGNYYETNRIVLDI